MMNEQQHAVSDAEHAGAKIYTPVVLLWFYDAIVYGLNAPHFWKCPASEMLAHYNRHISNNHLDVGVGTGYMLHRCHFPSSAPRLYLFDLNPNSLAATARRLARYQPRTLQGSVLAPLPYDGESFASIGLNFLIHCVPGSIAQKAVMFDHLAVHLQPGGVIFGSTILGEGEEFSRAGRRVFDKFNRDGVFHNTRDNEADLRRALEDRFADVLVRRVGHVAIFSARKRSPA